LAWSAVAVVALPEARRHPFAIFANLIASSALVAVIIHARELGTRARPRARQQSDNGALSKWIPCNAAALLEKTLFVNKPATCSAYTRAIEFVPKKAILKYLLGSISTSDTCSQRALRFYLQALDP
jgi:hypothetical protein